MSEENHSEEQVGTVVAERKPEIMRPPMYKVMLLNDNYTPMNFVVDILTQYFHKTQEQATKVMLQVHYDGAGIAGIFRAEIAETKVALVNQFSRESGHPLLCTMEEDE